MHKKEYFEKNVDWIHVQNIFSVFVIISQFAFHKNLWSAWLFFWKVWFTNVLLIKPRAPDSVAQNNAFIFMPSSNQKRSSLLLVDNNRKILETEKVPRKTSQKVKAYNGFIFLFDFSLNSLRICFHICKSEIKLHCVPFW